MHFCYNKEYFHYLELLDVSEVFDFLLSLEDLEG